MPKQTVLITTVDEASVSTVEDNTVISSSLKCRATDPPQDPTGDQPIQEQPSDSPEESGADPAAVSAISLSKTPIMRMKTKSEPKKIAVSLKSADEAAEGLARGGDGELSGEQEPIEAPLGPMTPMEMFLHDPMKFGGGGFLVSSPSEQQRKSSILNPTILPAGLAQVENEDYYVFGTFFSGFVVRLPCLYLHVKSQIHVSRLDSSLET